MYIERGGLTLVAGLTIVATLNVSAENIDPANDGSQYAWAENVGWINFSPSTAGVDIDPQTGMAFVSFGPCPGCAECAELHGFADLAAFDAAYEAGKVSDEGSFSWRSCGICNTSLGGDRHVWHGVHPDACIEDAKSAMRWLRQHAVELCLDPARQLCRLRRLDGDQIVKCRSVQCCYNLSARLRNPTDYFRGVPSLPGGISWVHSFRAERQKHVLSNTKSV